MFNIPDDKIAYTFETDKNGEFDTIEIEDGRVFDNYVFNADFRELPAEYRYVKGAGATFKGKNAFNFVKDEGTLQFKNPSIFDYSELNASVLETLGHLSVGKGSKIRSNLKFSVSSSLTVHWTLNALPLIIQDKAIQGSASPQTLELFYDDTTVDKDLYRQKLLNSNGIPIVQGTFECYKLRNNVKFGGSYKPFGPGTTHISLVCDSSPDGQVLLLLGNTDITDDDDDDSKSGGGGKDKVSGGGVAGIVIACLVIGIVVAFVIYLIQRKKIDRLKNEIPAENNDAYKTSHYETNNTSETAEYESKSNDDPFDDV